MATTKKLSEVLKRLSRNDLDGEMQVYYEHIKKVCEENGMAVYVNPDSSAPMITAVDDIEDTNYCMNIVFAEGIPSSNVVPVEIAQRIVLKKGVNLGNIVVKKSDYPLVDRMATFIVNSLIVAVEGAVTTLDALDESNFVVSTDVTAVRRYIEEVYPLADTPRCDVGILVYEEVLGERDINGRREVNLEPRFAVPGYTKFLDTTDTMMTTTSTVTRYASICVAGDVVTDVPVTGYAILGTVLFQQAMRGQRHWADPYQQFGVEGAPNIGVLMQDAEGKLINANEPSAFAYVVENCLPPVPRAGYEVTDGRPRIALMDIAAVDTNRFLATIGAFFGAKTLPVINIDKWEMTEYTGVIPTDDNGVARVSDSRGCDYISMATLNPMRANDYKVLARITPIDVRENIMRDIYGGAYRAYYKTRTGLLPDGLLDLIAQPLANTKRITWEDKSYVVDTHLETLAQYTPATPITPIGNTTIGGLEYRPHTNL